MTKRKTIQSEAKVHYWKGTKPIPDTKFRVWTIINDKFIDIGIVYVSGKVVVSEMRSHMSIKGYEPSDIAMKIAREKFKVNPVMVEQIYEGDE